jgi:hypothetical protein
MPGGNSGGTEGISFREGKRGCDQKHVTVCGSDHPSEDRGLALVVVAVYN